MAQPSVAVIGEALLDIAADGAARPGGSPLNVEGAADFAWTAAELRVPPAVRALHFGSLASWLPPGGEVVAAAVDALPAEVLVSYDPNVRPALQPDATRARVDVEASVARAHVVKASADDLRHVYGDEPAATVAHRWLTLGPRLVVITHGGGGASARRRTRSGLSTSPGFSTRRTAPPLSPAPAPEPDRRDTGRRLCEDHRP